MFEDTVNGIFSQFSHNQVMLEARRDLRRSSAHHFPLLPFALEQTHETKMWGSCKILPWVKPEWCGDLRAERFSCISNVLSEKKIDVELKSCKLWRNIWTLGQSPKPDLEKKTLKKSINMQLMFMEEAKLTSLNIKRLCFRTELLATWVQSKLGWGSAFPQENCVPCVHNLLNLPFCWRIAQKKSQYSLFRVLEISAWWSLAFTSLETVVILSIFIPLYSCHSQKRWSRITLVLLLPKVN